MPTFDKPIMDEGYHIELVQQIRSDEGMTDEPYFRAPLYPYFLAFTDALTGGSFFGMRLIQIILGSFLPILVYLLGRRMFDEKIARVAAIISVFYPTFLYYDSSLLITFLMVLLTVTLLWQLHRCEEHHRLREFAIAGLLLGLAGIARPNILVLGPALILWVWLVLVPKLGWPEAVKRFAVIGLVSLAVVMPVTIRNYVVSDDFVLIAWQGGYNFYLGNNRDSEGWSAVAKGIDPTWRGGYDESIRIAEAGLGKSPLLRSEVSDYWYERGWEEIAADPGHWIGLLVNKLRLTFNGYEIPNNQNMYLVREYVPVIKPLMFANILFFPFGLIAPLALIGLALTFPRWRKYVLLYVFLAAYIGTLLFFFTTARFRQPFLPILILLAVFASVRLYEWYRKRQFQAAAIAVTAFVVLAVETNHNLLGNLPNEIEAYDHFMLGTVFESSGNIAGASSEYRTALEMQPTMVPAMINLGIISANQGQTQRAAQYFAMALKVDPSFHQAYLNLANMLGRMERHAESAEVLERGVAQEPLNPDMHHQLALAYYRLNRFQESLTAVNEALRLNPNNPPARRLQARLREILSGQG